MKKQATPAKGNAPKAPKTPSFNDRKLCGTNPLKEQFEPTDAAPVRQHYKMAGGA